MLSKRMKVFSTASLRGSVLFFGLWALVTSNALGAKDLTDIVQGLNIDEKQISVSGISSGGFFTTQFHVAHSEHVMGAGIVAGGPYYCAKGDIWDAVTRCSKTVGITCQKFLGFFGKENSDCGERFPDDHEGMEAMAEASYAEAKKRNDLKNIKGDKIYLFSGLEDEIVPTGVMGAVREFYLRTGIKDKNIRYNDGFPTDHAMVRDSFDRSDDGAVNECFISSDGNKNKEDEDNNYIDDCQATARSLMADPGLRKNACSLKADDNYDKKKDCLARMEDKDLADVSLAGAILKHIYGEAALSNGRELVDEDEEIQAFDQDEVFKGFSSTPYNDRLSASMAEEGYIFVPETCKKGERCKLHVAFHGCLQGGDTDNSFWGSSNLYAKYAGYNEWAKKNSIVLLYPQVESRNTDPINPQGCWDWWGQDYTHENYHTKDGLQIKAVAQMINTLVGKGLLEIPTSTD